MKIIIEKRNTAINDTKIKYISVANKIYEITAISFFYMTVEAHETNLSIADVPEDELWDILEFKDYRLKLINNCRLAEIINFKEWKNQNIGNKTALSSK